MNKTLHFDKLYKNITVKYRQYWKVLGHWLKFLEMDRNACEDNAAYCAGNLVVGKEIFVHTLHPTLNPFTPYGAYRSLQVYFDEDGAEIGCVDMVMLYEP